MELEEKNGFFFPKLDMHWGLRTVIITEKNISCCSL